MIKRLTAVLALAIFTAVMLFHVLTIVSARFRIPVEPLTFLGCALAIDEAMRRLLKLAWQVIDRQGATPEGGTPAPKLELVANRLRS